MANVDQRSTDLAAARYPAPSAGRPGRGATIASFICSGVALIILPPIVGLAALILGIVGRAKGDRLATWAIVASLAAIAAGMLLGLALLNATEDDAALQALLASVLR